jgi:hypothetical protein
MTARYAVLTALATAVLSAPASASAAAIAVDQGCYAEGGLITISGSGFTPNSIATFTIGGTTSSADTDENGAFSGQIDAPDTTLKHPGAQQMTLTSKDTNTFEEVSAQVNVAKVDVDTVPAQSKPHKRITWNIAGYPNQKAMYGHWRFHGKTRGNHRMGVPQGPCGVLHVKARLLEASPVRFGRWTEQFDFNRKYDKHAEPRIVVPITIFRTFG